MEDHEPIPHSADDFETIRTRMEEPRRESYRATISQVATEHLLDQHVGHLDPDADHAGQDTAQLCR